MKFTQVFEITQWDQAAYDEAGSIQLGRATVGKTFTGGELEGTSSAELLMVGTADGPAAYTAMERFTGTLGGRKGSFVMLHGATTDQNSSPGRIVAADCCSCSAHRHVTRSTPLWGDPPKSESALRSTMISELFAN